MSVIRRKDKITEAPDAANIFVPGKDAFKKDPPVPAYAQAEQFPILEAEPIINIGIMREKSIDFEIDTEFLCVQTGERIGKGTYRLTADDGFVAFQNGRYSELVFTSTFDGDKDVFTLHDVTIGVGFHWERKENQRFQGALKVLVDDGYIVAVNSIPAESYLRSVISSEMAATSSLELLKAHAVISRSWLMAHLLNKDGISHNAVYGRESDDEIVRWYERDAHTLFDVCADDHCQRYQGVARSANPNVRMALEATRGQVLTYGDTICDARFSKCCGGVSEYFENCWADKPHPYLLPIRDNNILEALPDLTVEENARKWICSSPYAFCNTTDESVLAQVLNDYDLENKEFFRWTVRYSQTELSEVIKSRSGIDFGMVTALEPVERGASGRIVRLRVVGTKMTKIVGKELEIRRWLSISHLRSSAFVVDRVENGDFILFGAGWGHGVGLCQIGAAVMGEKGYKYEEILAHYFINSSLSTIY